MSVEMFGRAQNMMRSLQTSEQFEHVGMESRGIRVQTDSLVQGISGIAHVSPDLTEPVSWLGGLIQKVSEDYGTYVRVKGGHRGVFINVRGLTGHIGEQTPIDQLMEGIQRRSGFHVDINSDGTTRVSAETTFLEVDGRELRDVINDQIRALTDGQREKLAHGLFEVVNAEIAQSGEFVDLG